MCVRRDDAKRKRTMNSEANMRCKDVDCYQKVFVKSLRLHLSFFMMNSSDSKPATIHDEATINDDCEGSITILSLNNVFEEAVRAEATYYAWQVLLNKAVNVHDSHVKQKDPNYNGKDRVEELLYNKKPLWNDQDFEFNSVVSDITRKAKQLGFPIHTHSSIVYFILPSSEDRSDGDNCSNERNSSLKQCTNTASVNAIRNSNILEIHISSVVACSNSASILVNGINEASVVKLMNVEKADPIEITLPGRHIAIFNGRISVIKLLN